jgi:hypothetical protein
MTAVAPYADVAELVDALASGASARKGVEVQVLSSAPKRNYDTKVLYIGALFCLALIHLLSMSKS